MPYIIKKKIINKLHLVFYSSSMYISSKLSALSYSMKASWLSCKKKGKGKRMRPNVLVSALRDSRVATYPRLLSALSTCLFDPFPNSASSYPLLILFLMIMPTKCLSSLFRGWSPIHTMTLKTGLLNQP